METLKIDSKWLSQFNSYKRWYDSLTRRSRNGKVSRGMRDNYDSVLKQLTSYVNSKEGLEEFITPDSLVEWAETAEPDIVIDLLNGFEQWLQGEQVEGYTIRVPTGNERLAQPNTAYLKAQGIARGFFSHNRVWLPKGRKTNGHVAKTKTNDTNYAVFVYDDESEKIVQDYTQLRYFLSNLSFRDQTIALCLLTTSQDIGDLLTLDIDFVRSQTNKKRLYWAGARAKTGEIFKTFFSREASKHLRQYIRTERNDAEPTDPIFVKTGGRIRKEGSLQVRNVTSTFKDVAKKMGIDNGDAQNPFRPKRLRSIFSTACFQAKIDDGARHIFMGHSATMSEKYREVPVANLEAIYARVEPFLTVYAEDSTAELIETRRKSAQAYDLALDLKEENKRLTEMVDNLAERLGGLEGLQARIDELESYLVPDGPVLNGELKALKKSSIEESKKR